MKNFKEMKSTIDEALHGIWSKGYETGVRDGKLFAENLSSEKAREDAQREFLEALVYYKKHGSLPNDFCLPKKIRGKRAEPGGHKKTKMDDNEIAEIARKHCKTFMYNPNHNAYVAFAGDVVAAIKEALAIQQNERNNDQGA